MDPAHTPKNLFHQIEDFVQQHQTKIAALTMDNRRSITATNHTLDKLKAELKRVGAALMHLAKSPSLLQLADPPTQSPMVMASSLTNLLVVLEQSTAPI